MVEVIGVRFRDAGKVYYFDPGGVAVEQDQPVVVETARGIECGSVVLTNREVNDGEIVKPLKKMVRLATTKDLAQLEENRRREAKAFELCQAKITEHKMDMKLVDVEYAFDGSKILFYFTAEGRVDFRDLVKDLAGVFRTRIELRQIGVRDEAKMLGGLGICGRVFCCASFLGDFQPVSIKMAKEQGLSLNPTKISGTCGRLMCCLKYEQPAYDDLLRTTPKNGTPVSTPDGHGVVTEVSLLSGMIKVKLDSGDGFKSFHKSQLRSDRGDTYGEAPARLSFAESKRSDPLSQLLADMTPEEPKEQAAGDNQNRPRRQDRPQGQRSRSGGQKQSQAGGQKQSHTGGSKNAPPKQQPASEGSAEAPHPSRHRRRPRHGKRRGGAGPAKAEAPAE